MPLLDLSYPSANSQRGWVDPGSGYYGQPLLGSLELVESPDEAVLTKAEAKLQCRVTSSDEDSAFDDYIAMATSAAEMMVDGHRQLLTATYDLPLRGFWCNELTMPRPPLQSVTWIKYYDENGTLTTLDSSYYSVRTPWRQPGLLSRVSAAVFPSVQCDLPFPVTVRFVCGYSDPSQVPPEAKHAIKLLVQDAYERNGPNSEALQKAAQCLMDKLAWGSYA